MLILASRRLWCCYTILRQDIDSFIRKVDAVQKQLDGLKDGTITVAQLEAQEQKEEEQARKREEKAARAREKRARELAERRAKEAQEERRPVDIFAGRTVRRGVVIIERDAIIGVLIFYPPATCVRRCILAYHSLT